MNLNGTDVVERIKGQEKQDALNRFYPGQCCGNKECEKICADAYEIARKINIDPAVFIQNVIKREILPQHHCMKDIENITPILFTAPCKFGFVKPNLNFKTNQQSITFTDEKRSIIGKKYITDSSKSGVCKKCLENANRIFKWPEEAEKMPRLPIHPNCKCHYENIYAKGDIEEFIKCKIRPLISMYISARKKVLKEIAFWIDVFVDAVITMAAATTYTAFANFKSSVKLIIDAFAKIVSCYADRLLTLRKAIKIVLNILYLISSFDIIKKTIAAIQGWDQEIADCYTEIKSIHYDRLNMIIQKIQYLPKNPKEARCQLAKEDGWTKATEWENSYHKNNGMSKNVKYHNTKTGQEVIYVSDDDYAKIDFSIENGGTFNVIPPKDLKSKIFHWIYDVLPYWMWGNSFEDETSLGNRLIGN